MLADQEVAARDSRIHLTLSGAAAGSTIVVGAHIDFPTPAERDRELDRSSLPCPACLKRCVNRRASTSSCSSGSATGRKVGAALTSTWKNLGAGEEPDQGQ